MFLWKTSHPVHPIHLCLMISPYFSHDFCSCLAQGIHSFPALQVLGSGRASPQRSLCRWQHRQVWVQRWRTSELSWWKLNRILLLDICIFRYAYIYIICICIYYICILYIYIYICTHVYTYIICVYILVYSFHWRFGVYIYILYSPRTPTPPMVLSAP